MSSGCVVTLKFVHVQASVFWMSIPPPPWNEHLILRWKDIRHEGKLISTGKVVQSESLWKKRKLIEVFWLNISVNLQNCDNKLFRLHGDIIHVAYVAIFYSILFRTEHSQWRTKGGGCVRPLLLGDGMDRGAKKGAKLKKKIIEKAFGLHNPLNILNREILWSFAKQFKFHVRLGPLDTYHFRIAKHFLFYSILFRFMRFK